VNHKFIECKYKKVQVRDEQYQLLCDIFSSVRTRVRKWCTNAFCERYVIVMITGTITHHPSPSCFTPHPNPQLQPAPAPSKQEMVEVGST
jgi:hypothetical protein